MFTDDRTCGDRRDPDTQVVAGQREVGQRRGNDIIMAAGPSVYDALDIKTKSRRPDEKRIKAGKW